MTTATTLRLVTWNLNGLDDHHLDERTEAAVFISILGARLDQLQRGTKAMDAPDVIVFQEVVRRTFLAHIQTHLRAGGYTVLPHHAPDRQTFEVVAFCEPLVLAEHTVTPLRDSIYGRELLIADFDAAGARLRVVTGHFDSGTDAGRVRRAQLLQVNGVIGDCGVFAGDTNLRKAEWEAAKDDLVLSDAWEQVGSPAASQVTWRRDAYKARFDRVFSGRSLRARTMRVLGADPLPGINVEISDHVGLLVEFERRHAEPETLADSVDPVDT